MRASCSTLLLVVAALAPLGTAYLPTCLKDLEDKDSIGNYGKWCGTKSGWRSCFDKFETKSEHRCNPVSSVDAVCLYHDTCYMEAVPRQALDAAAEHVFAPGTAAVLDTVMTTYSRWQSKHADAMQVAHQEVDALLEAAGVADLSHAMVLADAQAAAFPSAAASQRHRAKIQGMEDSAANESALDAEAEEDPTQPKMPPALVRALASAAASPVQEDGPAGTDLGRVSPKASSIMLETGASEGRRPLARHAERLDARTRAGHRALDRACAGGARDACAYAGASGLEGLSAGTAAAVGVLAGPLVQGEARTQSKTAGRRLLSAGARRGQSVLAPGGGGDDIPALVRGADSEAGRRKAYAAAMRLVLSAEEQRARLQLVDQAWQLVFGDMVRASSTHSEGGDGAGDSPLIRAMEAVWEGFAALHLVRLDAAPKQQRQAAAFLLAPRQLALGDSGFVSRIQSALTSLGDVTQPIPKATMDRLNGWYSSHLRTRPALVLLKYRALRVIKSASPALLPLAEATVRLAARVGFDQAQLTAALRQWGVRSVEDASLAGDVLRKVRDQKLETAVRDVGAAVAAKARSAACRCDKGVYSRRLEDQPLVHRPSSSALCKRDPRHVTCRALLALLHFERMLPFQRDCVDAGSIGGGACRKAMVTSFSDAVQRWERLPVATFSEAIATPPEVLSGKSSAIESAEDNCPPSDSQCRSTVSALRDLGSAGCCKDEPQGNAVTKTARTFIDALWDRKREARTRDAPSQSDTDLCQGCINVLEEVRKNTGPHVGAYLRPGQVFSAPAVEDVRDALMGVCYDDTPDVFYESCDDMLEMQADLAATYAAGVTDVIHGGEKDGKFANGRITDDDLQMVAVRACQTYAMC